MKLLMENWRQYLNENEKAIHYGDLYLFEDDKVTKSAFYNALNTLSESDDDIDTFLENWEKSVDYQLQNLNEQDFSPLFKLATQAWMIQDKFKAKAAEKVIAVSKKINDFAEKNPKTVKFAKYAVAGLLAAAAVYYIYKVVDKGGDASDVMDLAQSLQPEDPDLARELAECAQDFGPEAVAEFAQGQTDTIEKVADTLSAAAEPALDQMGQAADSVAQDVKQTEAFDFWNDAFEKAAQERADAVQTGDVSWIQTSGVGPQDFKTLMNQVTAGDFNDESRRTFIKVLRKMRADGLIDTSQGREALNLWRDQNPSSVGKFLQKVGLMKAKAGPSGLDKFAAEFELGRLNK